MSELRGPLTPENYEARKELVENWYRNYERSMIGAGIILSRLEAARAAEEMQAKDMRPPLD